MTMLPVRWTRISMPLLAIAALSSCSASKAAGPCSLKVSTTAELNRAFECAPGNSEIVVASGNYDNIRIAGAANLMVRGESIADPPKLRTLTIVKSHDIHIVGFAISPADTDGRYGLNVTGSNSITLDRLHFIGPGPDAGEQIIAAAMLRNDEQLSLTNSNFEGFWHGISLLDVSKVQIADNHFRNMRTDGIRGGGASDIVIEGNVLQDFHPNDGDHPDGIQLWSTNQTSAARNITIRRNLVMRGEGSPTQGIFIRDTHRKLPFENLEVSDNLVVGSLYNGITIMGVDGAKLSGNEVIQIDDRLTWIRIEDARNVTLIDNRAPKFIVKGDVSERHDQVTSQIGNPVPSIKQWAEQRRVKITTPL